MNTFTPREVVSELDRFIVGQNAAKRAVAIALRNRWRRQQVRGELRDEIHPKNILMIGPTGVGKTEIARRLAKLAAAPFVKVEASKFTEVGYVGRDVESIVRDLVEVGVKLVREEELAKVRASAERIAEERLLDALYPRGPGAAGAPDATRERMREKLRDGSLEEREVELELPERAGPVFEILAPGGVEDVGGALKDLMGGFLPKKMRSRRLKVSQARELLRDDEAGRMIDAEAVREQAVARVEQTGIVFIDEIDKIARRESQAGGPDVSREGVQRDLLPIVEGTSVQTKHGSVRTDHVLFIAAGAFHVSRPSDLIPELQGRFPIRVELEDLDEAAFVRILEEPHNALVKQYQALLLTEGVTLEFKPDAVREIARIAAVVNRSTENIGARRLHTVLERLLDETLFDAPDLGGSSVVFDAARVSERLAGIAGDRELSRFIL